MASSFYSNSVHVDFESVLAMGEPGMVSMFQALVASGLQGFLGCPALSGWGCRRDFRDEDALVEFFANGTVRDGLVVSSVDGVVVEISEELFAETFDLPVDGFADVFEMPKDKIFDARSIVSLSGEPVILSGSKNQMKMHYRLLCDIMAKSISVKAGSFNAISVKAGSFNAITVEKFSLLTAVVCSVRMNWAKILFRILKKMTFTYLFWRNWPRRHAPMIFYGQRLVALQFLRGAQAIEALICLEVVEFCASRRLLPIGSLQFCRSSTVVESDFRVAPHPSPIFAFRVFQFCSIFIDLSVFNWFPSADISDFLSSIALERTAFRSVQRSFAASVVPSVQSSLDQRPYSPTTADSSSSLRFDTTDVDATASSLPPVSQVVSAALADLQVILSEQINESQSGISSKMHKIEQSFRDSLSDQAALFKSLSQEARQEGRSMDDVQTMRFNEFRKTILAQNASIFVGLADVHKEVQEVNVKVDIMASRLNVIQKDAEATKEALSHQLFEFQSQAQENQNILHAPLSELVDYIHRGSADKKGESGSRGLQKPANVQVNASAERTPTFAQRVEMAQRHIVHTVLDADANRALLERQAAAERDRERRRREARMLKRRRRD
ncbi:hypothetical protein F511_42828 [Dorcoceras hygrometricum]|uniref:ICln family transporter: chloride ion current inducer protein I(Cln) n=1 Tax=Dorcoceras hygrometricum TaxID=472368 RepID=A0A2Z7AT27_9LAMI|nr:hypothetical protein F511_42828 [Dorcoceras hygrometricum]